MTDKKPTDSDDEKKRPSQATILAAIGMGAELFHTTDGDGFARIAVEDHREVWPIRSKGFHRWLIREFYMIEGKPPGGQARADAIATIEARAQFDGEEHPVHLRIAEKDGGIYVDLCNPTWQVVEVTEDGWKMLSTPPVLHRRTRGMAALPVPKRGGSLDSLRTFVNVANDEDWHLLIVWLVAALRGQGPFPILCLEGEQGSAKSTTARVIRSIIDPSTAPLRTTPREERDLLIAASNGWVLSFDNLSIISPWLSDAFCRLATGGGFTTRELYTDKEEVIFEAQRPVIVNGINELAIRDDLRDRVVTLILPTIPDDTRRDEKGFWRDFESARPQILGALFDALSGALRTLPDVDTPYLPRMADFALLGEATEQALGWSMGSFQAAYDGNRSESVDRSIENDPVARTLLKMIPDGMLQLTATELGERLAEIVDDGVIRSPAWPKSPGALSNRLRRIAPGLRKVGFEVSLGTREGHDRRRVITLEKVGKRASSSSSASAIGPEHLLHADNAADVDGVFQRQSGGAKGD